MRKLKRKQLKEQYLQKNYFKNILPKISRKVEKNIKKIEEDIDQLKAKGDENIKKTLKALKKASKILQQAKKSKISPFFISPDLALKNFSISQEVSKKLEESLQQKIELKKEIESGLIDSPIPKRVSLLERIKRAVFLIIRRIAALLNLLQRSNVPLTQTGRKALEQLRDLYNLLLLEFYDEESLAALKIAYGEACFYITEASRQYYKKHKGKGRENYQEYFDRFVKSINSIQ
ncbi:MAG: hypothetical protein N3D10_00420 [Candidatus Micrarchaeota archaeon]|nr:hypothetical protein [Candidatus Micrarchaeota archaeon]